MDYRYIQLLTHINMFTQLYTGIYSCIPTLLSANMDTWIIGYIQLLTDINIDTQLYTLLYSCLHTLECANSYINGLQVYTAFDTH